MCVYVCLFSLARFLIKIIIYLASLKRVSADVKCIAEDAPDLRYIITSSIILDRRMYISR